MPAPAPRVKNVLIYIIKPMRHLNTKSAPLPKRILSQFATYRNAIARVAFVTTFLVISFLAMLPEVSRAQCPDSTFPGPNPDSIPWYPNGTASGFFPGTDCYVAAFFVIVILGIPFRYGWTPLGLIRISSAIR